MHIILVYDINTEETSKNLNKIFKISKRYLNHIQNSVFEGNLTDAEFLRFKLEVSKYIRNDCDSVIIFKNRNIRFMEKEILGKQEDNISVFL